MNRIKKITPIRRSFFHRLFALALGLVALVCAGCGSGSSGAPPTVIPAQASALSSIAVTPAQPSIALGSTQQFKAVGTYSDGSTQDLTSTATWSSTSTSSATVNATGLVSGVHSGTATIAAASGSISGSTTLTIDAGTILTASMSTARENHTATQLNDGTVLVAGGGDGANGVLMTAEVYDPVAATFALTGSMTTARESHTATLLANGLVLIAGGDSGSGPVASAEIYDPTAGTFTPTGNMNAPRESHTATLLYNGMVLIAGGSSTGGSLLATAELFNPATGTFALTGSMRTAREFHTAVAVISGPGYGAVLIAGGDNGSGAVASAELYDPNAGTFALTGNMTAARESHTATLLNGGTILISGGSTSSSGAAHASAEIYDPVAGTFSATGSMAAARFFQTATLLTNGTVLVSGGRNSTGILASQELFDPDSGTFAATADMTTPRDPFTATLITTGVNLGSVLMTGGQTSGVKAINTTELYEPITLKSVKIKEINVTPGLAGVLPGATQQYTAVGSYVSGGELLSETLVSVTWTSSTPAVAAIGGRTGLALGRAIGTTNIVASLGSVSSPAQVLFVSAPTCLYEFGPGGVASGAPFDLAPGNALQLSALALYTTDQCDNLSFVGFSVDQTTEATWTSSAPSVATVSSRGVVTAVSVGTTKIQATYGGVAALPLTVTVLAVASVEVTPANTSAILPNGTTKQFEANATLSNGDIKFGVTGVTWSSSSSSVGTISSAGLFTPVGPGTTTIRAVYDGVTGSTAFTIPSLASVAVTPANLVELRGSSQQFTATGVFADGETQDYTSIAKWSSSANSVATISSTGLSADVGSGPTIIQAMVAPVIGSTTVPAVTGSTTLTVADAGFVPTGGLNSGRYFHTATQLDDGSVLIAGGVDATATGLTSADLYDPATGKFTQTGNLLIGRAGHTATLLNNGKVLITGGVSQFGENGNPDLDIFPYDSLNFIYSLASAELYDPATGEFTATGNMNLARSGHTATLLNNGMVLIAGGAGDHNNGGVATATAELYDPATGTFTPTENMISAHESHTATLLNNGMVLIAGGNKLAFGVGNVLANAELYDPITGIFTSTGEMSSPREYQTATLLNNGTVLVSGGDANGYSTALDDVSLNVLATSELYNPATGTFTPTGSMANARHMHAATLLNNGEVLIEGGDSDDNPLVSAELYDPSAGTFSLTGEMANARILHTATLLSNGNVLIVGGAAGDIADFGASVAAAELFEPGTLTPPGLVSIAVTPANPSLTVGETQHFIATGTFSDNSRQQLASVNWSSSDSAVATVSSDASNAGTATGITAGSATITASAGSVSASTTLNVTAPVVATSSLTFPRYVHTATLLQNGTVLIAGGNNSVSAVASALATSEIYNPTAGTFALAGAMTAPRFSHTATPLANGLVLIAGGAGNSGPLASAELYNPATGKFTSTGDMTVARQNHSATLLPNGMVLIVGGNDSQYLSSAEIYNPATGTFTATGSMSTPRQLHTATLLNNGMVLIAGGENAGTTLASAELYNPGDGTFTLTASMNSARVAHTATLLNNGMVLLAGGQDNNGNVLGTAELYNPANGTFSLTGSMTVTREFHTATLLNNGMVLLAGGKDFTLTQDVLSGTELYDPSTGTFTTAVAMTTSRYYHTATLLNNGTVLLAAGETFENSNSVLAALASAELFTPTSLTPPGLISIAVTPASPSIAVGATQPLIATGMFSNNSTEQLASVTWSSSNTAVATVSNDSGNAASVFGVAQGTATITAGAGSVTGSVNLAVGEPVVPSLTSISVTPANPSITLGNKQQFTATGTFSDSSKQNLTASVTWASAATSTATIAAGGLATGAGVGTSSISATLGTASGSTVLTVTAPALVSIAVTPANPSIAKGQTQQFTATGTYSDSSTQNLTNSATWTSSATGVATISATGLATSAGTGPTTIQAALDGITGSATLTVTSVPVVESIAATSGTPQTATVGTAFAAPLVATVISNGSPASGVLVTFTAPAAGASGTFASGVNTATTDASGVATSAVFTANATTGAYTVTVSATGTSSTAGFSLTNTAAVATSTSFSFYLSGLEVERGGANFYTLAGSVSIDANGNVLAGEQDYNDALGLTSPQPSGDTITGGALTVNATTGQGTLTLITNNEKLGTSGAETLGVQFVNLNHALIVQFDGTATSSGSMDLQTLPARLSGGFAFTLSGEDPNLTPLVYGGVFSISGTDIQNGAYDEEDDENAPVLGQPFTGTISAPDGSGRGTITGTDLGGSPLTINYYIVGPEAIRLIDVDADDTAVGSAFGQGAATFSASSLGRAVFAVQSNSIGSLFTLAAMLTTDPGGGTFQGVADYDNSSGNISSALPISGTYSIASNGYGNLTILELNDEPCPLGIYMIDPNLNLNDPNNTDSGLGGALVVNLDQFIGSGGSGVLIPQTDTSALSFVGNYAFGAQDYNDLNDGANGPEFDFVGQGSVSSGTLSGTGLLSDPFFTLLGSPKESTTYSEVGFSGTPLADPNNAGRYTMSSNNATPNPFVIALPTDPSSRTDFNVVIYQASGDQLFMMGEDTFGSFLGPLEQQGSVTGLSQARGTKSETRTAQHR